MSRFIAICSTTLLFACTSFAQDAATQPVIHVPHEALKKLSWQLAIPTATFADKTVFEAIDLLHEQDIHHLELSPGQALSADMPDQKAGETLSDSAITALLAKLKSHHMDIVSYGPVQLDSEEQINRAIFGFAKKIKAKNIVATVKDLELADKLANEYQISVAVEDSGYATPVDFAKALAGRSNRIGSDGDFSSWTDPVAAVQLLHGRLIQLRMPRPNAEVIAEFKKQNFKGVLAVTIKPGAGPSELGMFVKSVNQLADVLQK